MPQKRLPQETVDKIKERLSITDMPHREIATELGVSVGTVGELKKKYNIIRPVITKEPVEKSDPTNERILELESKLLACKDDTRRLKRAYDASQRNNSIYQALADDIKDLVAPIKPLPRAKSLKSSTSKIRESLVMHLSDEHAADVILPHQVGGLENYNMGIALRRAEAYVDSTLKFTQTTLKGYEFHTLYVLANGDHVSGEIHNAKDHTEYRNVLRNSIAVGQMHSLMLRDLAPHFENVKVIYTPGNHGRRSIKKDHNAPRDNWDYLVAETAAGYCRDLVNVEFIIPDSFSLNVDIEGHGFHIAHGDDIKGWNGIPWYGIERKTRRMMALSAATDRRIDYFCFGHFHNPATQAALNGETIINGTWVACSPYVYNSISSFTEPSQIIHGVHAKKGVSWRLHIKLRTPDEHLGPRRYAVVMA